MDDRNGGLLDCGARTPEPPYYAVVFTSVRTTADPEGYAVMADRMVELASAQPGFLGMGSRDPQELSSYREAAPAIPH